MTHEEIRELAQDNKFVRILEVAMIRTAGAVALENTTAYQPSGIVKRHTEALRIIQNLQDERKKFAILIAKTENVNSLITIDSSRNFVWPEDITAFDSVMTNTCSANFNVVAGLEYAETQV